VGYVDLQAVATTLDLYTGTLAALLPAPAHFANTHSKDLNPAPPSTIRELNDDRLI
jgi:hypothetical protein